MTTYHITNKGKIIKIEVLTIDEAKDKNRLTKDEAIGYHTWNKNENNHVDNKHIIYAFNVLPNNPPTDWVVIKWFDNKNCVIEFDNN
ncbi:hypothetical protein [Chryseobacterium sp. 5_R23647]|uniref:hypothetical protein n=1 Tax=Chryseobacterium sp. 5_R23647 TaxID=2258964 RepID=UPI000E282829|nr:hypothetical protein [Chryseobacterium sp. 5_R23647]REC40522.1 hypothetical protein DRF69_18685 [Chryseobacterium sp. 5_R23647]